MLPLLNYIIHLTRFTGHEISEFYGRQRMWEHLKAGLRWITFCLQFKDIE